MSATEPLRPVTDAINAIAAEVNLSLDLAAGLMKAIDGWGAYRAAGAARAERECVARLAADRNATYLEPCDEDDHERGFHTHHRRPFADLIRATP